MVVRRTNLGWLVAAWAAVFLQAVPAACSGDCDRSCCQRRVAVWSPSAAEPGDSGECPSCAAVAVACDQAAEATDRPCRCHLVARRNQPLAASTDSHRNLAASDTPAVLTAVPPIPPQVLGVSREYLAASLTVPVRPPRILFGVWRE